MFLQALCSKCYVTLTVRSVQRDAHLDKKTHCVPMLLLKKGFHGEAG